MANKTTFESSLHDIVYSIDQGSGLKIIKTTLYILLVLIITLLYTATQFKGLKTEEAMDYAQLGRNISLKDGMTTKCVRPLSMWKMASLNATENPQIVGHPDLLHPPAYPALLSVGFKFFDLIGIDLFAIPEGGRISTIPAEQWVIVPLNHTFAILTGLIIFSLGKRMFTREIGLIAMTLYYLSNLVWQDSISGLNLSMAIFFTTASFYTMIVASLNRRDNKSKVRWIVPFLFSIVFAAIAFLTRYIAIAIVPGICLFAWLVNGRFRGGTRLVLLFVLLYTLMVSPWLVRNYKACGNPIGLVGYSALADSPKFSGNALDRDFHPEVTMSSATAQLKQKWNQTYSGEQASAITSLGGGLVMTMFLASFFYHFVRPPVNDLRWGIGLSLLLTAIIAGFFSDSSIRMLHAFWPFALLFGLSFFYLLLDRLDIDTHLYTISLKVLFCVLAVIPLIMTIIPPHSKHPYPPYHAPFVSKVSEMLTPREVLCTDIPWATAWYGDRVSILLPKDLDQFYEINDYKQYISGIYFTTVTKNKPFVKQLLDGPEKSWLPIMTGQLPPDFPLKNGLPLNRVDQLFLSDRNRWSNTAEEQ